MTEGEWERCIELRPMLEFVWNRITARKSRLFAVACCRRQWEMLPPSPPRQCVKIAERFADGTASEEELQRAAEGLEWGSPFAYVCRLITAKPTEWTAVDALQVAGQINFARYLQLGGDVVEYGRDPDPEEYQQVTLLYDIVGNPFHPVTIDPNWLTSTVVAIARRMYQTRDFSPLPILADALQDAGCENEAILEHCRGPGQHVRGCWVVDQLLGKE